jgi:hypothetical protein
MKVMHRDKHPHLAVLLDRPFHFGSEVRIVRLRERPAQFQDQQLPTRFFVQFD